MANDNWKPWVWIKWKQGTPSTAWELWKGNSAIQSAWSLQGDWDCVLWLNVSTPDELESFVWNTIRKNEWVESTSTNWSKKWW